MALSVGLNTYNRSGMWTREWTCIVAEACKLLYYIRACLMLGRLNLTNTHPLPTSRIVHIISTIRKSEHSTPYIHRESTRRRL
jgi:hypothetical protein